MEGEQAATTMKRGAEDMDAEADGSGGRAAKLRSNGDMHEHPEHAPHQLPPPPPRSEFPSGADHNQRERRPWNPLALPEGERAPREDPFLCTTAWQG